MKRHEQIIAIWGAAIVAALLPMALQFIGAHLHWVP
jgi:hypothetical protein